MSSARPDLRRPSRHHLSPIGAAHPRRILSRSLIVAVMTLAGLTLLGSLLVLSHGLTWFGPLGHPWQFTVPTEGLPEGGPMPAWTPGGTDVFLNGVSVSTMVDLAGPRRMAAWGFAWPFLVMTGACATAIALGVCLLRDRPFRRLGSIALALLSVLSMVGAVAAPWLTLRGQHDAVVALGLLDKRVRTVGGVEMRVSPRDFVPPDLDWTLLAFGVVCALAAWLLWRAHRLEADADGLV